MQFALLLLLCMCCSPSCFARVCTRTAYVLSHTHVKSYVYTCCPFFVLHVSLALFVFVFVFNCACLHMYNVCIISYTCKPIRLCRLPVLFCFAIYDCLFCSRVFVNVQHMHDLIYIVCVVVDFLRVFAIVQHMHYSIHMYMYTSIQFALVLLCCMLACPLSLRVFAHVHHMHYLIHM